MGWRKHGLRNSTNCHLKNCRSARREDSLNSTGQNSGEASIKVGLENSWSPDINNCWEADLSANWKNCRGWKIDRGSYRKSSLS